MANSEERNWTASIVIAFKDRQLNALARELEDEIRHVLARIDQPHDVAVYLEYLTLSSKEWNHLDSIVKDHK